jgi:hypothetical protein
MSSIISSNSNRVFSFIGMILRHPLLIYKTNKRGKELIKSRESTTKITYKIPKYEDTLSYCKSTDKYLRPVRLCNPHAPEIIAMANKLGAFKVSEKEFAENVFNFVKNNIRTKNVPVFGAVKTLKKGYGSCFDSSGLFITLCRCGGLPSRYKIYIHLTPPSGFQELKEVSDQRLLEGLAIVSSYYTVTEVMIDGKWLECEASSPPELDAYWNVPIAQFGESCGNVGGWFPDKIIHLEKLPLRIILPTNIMFRLFGGIMESINEHIDENWEAGKKKLDDMGRKEYNKKARKRYDYFPSLDD